MGGPTPTGEPPPSLSSSPMRQPSPVPPRPPALAPPQPPAPAPPQPPATAPPSLVPLLLVVPSSSSNEVLPTGENAHVLPMGEDAPMLPMGEDALMLPPSSSKEVVPVPIAVVAPSVGIQDGVDPYSTYVLTVRIIRAGSRFEGAWVFDWTIDSDTTNFKDFVDDICEKYPWGIDETVTVQYLDSGLNLFCTISSDNDLMTMLKCFGQNKTGDVFITINGSSDESIIGKLCTPSVPIPSQACISQISNEPLEDVQIVTSTSTPTLVGPPSKKKRAAAPDSSSCNLTTCANANATSVSSSGPNQTQNQCALLPVTVTEASTPPPKAKAKGKNKAITALPDSPSMSTRSKKKLTSTSPSMSTRSKRKLI
uniref:PB1 domain-containing protein n=1 Tax=Oryza barthii TaxID=65489 RepID=A0A0D3EXK8_9ORYZ